MDLGVLRRAAAPWIEHTVPLGVQQNAQRQGHDRCWSGKVAGSVLSMMHRFQGELEVDVVDGKGFIEAQTVSDVMKSRSGQ